MFGVPTNSSISNLPGRVTAASKLRRRFVATMNTLNSVYSVYSVYRVYSVYSVYSVYRVYRVYTLPVEVVHVDLWHDHCCKLVLLAVLLALDGFEVIIQPTKTVVLS